MRAFLQSAGGRHDHLYPQRRHAGQSQPFGSRRQGSGGARYLIGYIIKTKLRDVSKTLTPEELSQAMGASYAAYRGFGCFIPEFAIAAHDVGKSSGSFAPGKADLACRLAGRVETEGG